LKILKILDLIRRLFVYCIVHLENEYFNIILRVSAILITVFLYGKTIINVE